jgi:hypothetical protein
MTDVIPEQQAVDLDKLESEASVGTDELDEASSSRPSRRHGSGRLSRVRGVDAAPAPCEHWDRLRRARPLAARGPACPSRL